MWLYEKTNKFNYYFITQKSPNISDPAVTRRWGDKVAKRKRLSSWHGSSTDEVARHKKLRTLRQVDVWGTWSVEAHRRSPRLARSWTMLRKLIAKEDQTTNLEVLLLQLFLLLSRSLLLFLLPPQYFVFLSLPRSACGTRRTEAPPEKRERGPEQVVQLLSEQS